MYVIPRQYFYAYYTRHCLLFVVLPVLLLLQLAITVRVCCTFLRLAVCRWTAASAAFFCSSFSRECFFSSRSCLSLDVYLVLRYSFLVIWFLSLCTGYRPKVNVHYLCIYIYTTLDWILLAACHTDGASTAAACCLQLILLLSCRPVLLLCALATECCGMPRYTTPKISY